MASTIIDTVLTIPRGVGLVTKQKLRGQAVLITGGGSGIGLALGRAMAAQGAHVVLADVDRSALEDAAALSAHGPEVRCEPLDVRDRSAFVEVVARLVAERGGIDCLVNCAGVSLGGPSHELTGEHWDHAIDINLGGVVNGVLAAYPHMVSAGHGQIVNVASGAGLVAPPFVTAYATTKHAVVGLSLGLRPEAALHGVRVSVVCPGAVDTPILDRQPPAHLPSTATPPVTPRRYLAAIGQKPIAPDDFAAMALRKIARNRPVVIVPPSDRALWLLQRISPGMTLRITGALARKVQRDLLDSHK